MRRLLLAAILAAACLPAHAAADGLLGDWREPSGSVIRVAPCGPDICATLVTISAQAPTQFDIHNPDKGLRSHRLCGLVIGKGFHSTSPSHAEDGTLYDPKTGNTYHGEITANGNTLDLRGYIGIKLFGRTQSWTRTSSHVSCAAS